MDGGAFWSPFAASVTEVGRSMDGVYLGEYKEHIQLRHGPVNDFYARTHIDIMWWGIASIFSSVLLLLTYSCIPDVRRTHGWQFLYSSLCEIYVAFGFITLSLIYSSALVAATGGSGADGSGAAVSGGGGRGGGVAAVDMEHLICSQYSGLLASVLGFDMAANCWKLLMYIDLIVVYHNPFRPSESGARINSLFESTQKRTRKITPQSTPKRTQKSTQKSTQAH